MFGMDEVWRRLPDNVIAQIDPTVVAKYLPDAARSSSGAMPAANATRPAPVTNAVKQRPQPLPQPNTAQR